KDFYPDFNVQYMWQRTDPTQFRAYYMLSVGIKVPIYRSRKQRPELAQAESEQVRARSELQAQSQRLAGDLRSQYVIVQQTSELLKKIGRASCREREEMEVGHGSVKKK